MRISTGERFLAVLGYVAILFIVPVRLRRDSMFVQFHARQGGVLFGIWLVLMVVLVVTLLLVQGVAVAQTVVIALVFLATAWYILFAVIGILKVMLGERYRMPLVADVALMLRL